MIKLPPDGRQEVGQRIEALVYGLETLVTQYLNMLSVADRPQGIAKVRSAFTASDVLSQVLGID